MLAGEARERAVRAPRPPVTVCRVDGTRAAIVGHVDVRELLDLHLVQERVREPERCRIEIHRQLVIVAELRQAVAQREHRVVRRQPRVVQREDADAALQQVIARVSIAVRASQSGFPVVGAGLVRQVVEVEPRQRDLVGELLVDLAGVHDGAVFDLRGAFEVGAAIAHVAQRIRVGLRNRLADRADAVGGNHVARERLASVAVGIARQRVVDHDEVAAAVKRLREVAVALARGREAQ